MAEEIPFGVWLRKQRRALDLSRQAFADQVGCAEVTLRRIEAGSLKPSKELANLLLDKLGIPEVERSQWIAFARGLSGFPTQSTPLSNKPITNLPTPLTSFIGRHKEQSDVISLITKHRLVTLTGSGGVGKTRLSIRVGEQILGNYPQGVWLVELASLSDPALLSQTVATLFGLTLQSHSPLMDLLINFLRAKSAVLILDNCEHLLDACAHFSDTLLKNCSQLKILATSRESLGVTGEAIYRVPSLELPDSQLLIDSVRGFEAVSLFEERAKLAQFDFSLDLENALSVVQICHRLDGIPLAIELAAAKVGVMSTEQIVKQLDESFKILSGGSRTALPHHQTLQASIDWSWSLLSKEEQIFLRQLSVFAGGWALESAQSVCDDEVLSLTSALVKKSLITVDQKVVHETRFHFHEIVRQYLRERLLQSGEEENKRTRHLQYFLQLSEQAEPGLKGPTQVDWMSRLNSERDNLRAALEWADKTDVEAGLLLSSRLSVFWEIFDIREGAHWLEKFIQKTESKAYTFARAKALWALGWFENYLQRVTEARLYAQESLDSYRICGDKYGEVDALLLLVTMVNPSEAGELHNQALTLAESINDKWRTAYALYLWTWDNTDPYSDINRALALFREVGDLRYMGECMAELGRLKMLNNEIEPALKMLNEATILFRKLKIKSGTRGILQCFGRIAALKGDYEQAYTYLQEDVEIAQEYGYRINYLFTRSHLGYLALYQGNITGAHKLFTETLQSFFDDKNEFGVVFTLEGMAGLFVAIARPVVAAQLIGWADATREKISDPRPPIEQADVDKIIAACLVTMGAVAFSDAYDEGQKMTMDEAIALALDKH